MRFTQSSKRCLIALLILIGLSSLPAQAETKAELIERVSLLEQELAAARSALQVATTNETLANERATQAEIQLTAAQDKTPTKIQIGDFTIGGAIRANYVIGDYPNSNGPSRGGDGGNFELDTFRINIDYVNGPVIGKAEYRFYDGYNFLHTGWLGYNFEDDKQVQVGLNRVPFGPSPYGVSQSWFFDQHYYVGLADDMDLGIKYTTHPGDWTIDLAYYYSAEWQGRGSSRDSARYSYDVVDETGNGYEERNQFNLRAIYSTTLGEVDADLGTSLQAGQLQSNGDQDDGELYAGSLHAIFQWNNWKLTPQITYYKYDVSKSQVQSGDVTDEEIDLGAYNFAWPVATEAWIPAVSLSYFYETSRIDWLDSITPYVEYSSLMKTEGSFNDSDLFILGAAWARGGWYIYTDLAFSNGNYFVGGDEFTTFGANPDNDWQSRFNINFGYYF
ncbi:MULTISPECIES: hypothetical protein [unclassified Lentimonas]|uniref:hypothetical protein n=1 Tax=unclassified Lentimonas TaxID=2630993 RepID=UPI001323B3B1|nr:MULTISPECIES: hypothetical protein [unclassified Lentimonas]CAA6679164.1 FIG00609243: hypothetical protein [Lentimonas sp. CC4]CAA6684092.1 FIG00609243: hypothetical protein [Lentimonas sp. CC6]CAA6689768.1 FIG00609243: hypothetical protein [Lentimonas sp. CC10]CAA6694769.1 FIG00609243: hypothetical protein [Lentimonas sp. CC19]CAA7069506.1 FIG00609243: hypothetical protein [Lentimonas sp. CC11]